MELDKKIISDRYLAFISKQDFPCVAAKSAASKLQVETFVAGHIGCPADDEAILSFLYSFADRYREATTPFHSAAVIFAGTEIHSEEQFDTFLWKRLQSLSNLDARQYPYDHRVAADPQSGDFSFSLKAEAFFIIGLHPLSSRMSRQFTYPAIVFNPHAEFQQLRDKGSYEKMKNIVRKRDLAFSGSLNPMLHDFGNVSETLQYSGRNYDQGWQCPLKISHGTNDHSGS